MRAFVKKPKRGRPRKPVEGPDRGTPEQQLRRFQLVGEANPTLASYPLGVLLAKSLITQDQHNIGLDYARHYRVVSGKDRRPSGLAEVPEEVLIEMQARFDQMSHALKRVGRRSKDAVDNVAVFERFPGWLFRRTIRQSDAVNLRAINRGLYALESAFAKRAA